MIFREATIQDIPKIQEVRHSVKENVLSDPALVTDNDCAVYLVQRGKGWVCESDQDILGFAIADLRENNIWALFVNPAFEKQGIGRKLHDIMMDWFFSQTKNTCWLGTAPGTRASFFYKEAGWTESGKHGKNEIRFEMKYEAWKTIRHK